MRFCARLRQIARCLPVKLEKLLEVLWAGFFRRLLNLGGQILQSVPRRLISLQKFGFIHDFKTLSFSYFSIRLTARKTHSRPPKNITGKKFPETQKTSIFPDDICEQHPLISRQREYAISFLKDTVAWNLRPLIQLPQRKENQERNLPFLLVADAAKKYGN
jgi:hypothetical protein